MYESNKFQFLCLTVLLIACSFASLTLTATLFAVLTWLYYDYDWNVNVAQHGTSKVRERYRSVKSACTNHVNQFHEKLQAYSMSSSVNEKSFEISAFSTGLFSSMSNGAIPKNGLAARYTSTPLSSSLHRRNKPRVSANHVGSGTSFFGSPRYNLSDVSFSPKSTYETQKRSPVQTVAGPLLVSTRFNVNLSTYTDAQSQGLVTRLVQYDNEAKKRNRTHQEKYNRPEQFPIVNLQKSNLPVLSPKNRRVTLRIAPPDSLTLNSAERNAMLSETLSHGVTNGLHEPVPESEISTRSVLDALKEISRKRIHSDEDLQDISKRQRKDSLASSQTARGKRIREITPPGLSSSPYYNSIDMQLVKRYKMPNEIECSLSSSRNLFQGIKRKAAISGLVSSPVETKQLKLTKTVETQTASESPEDTMDVAEHREQTINSATQTASQAAPEKHKDAMLEDLMKSKKLTRKCLNEEPEQASKVKEIPAVSLQVFDPKPLEIMRKNKLSIILGCMTGKEPEIIPLETPTLSDRFEIDKNDNSLTSIISKKDKPKHDKHVSFSLPETAVSDTPNIGENSDKVETSLKNSEETGFTVPSSAPVSFPLSFSSTSPPSAESLSFDKSKSFDSIKQTTPTPSSSPVFDGRDDDESEKLPFNFIAATTSNAAVTPSQPISTVSAINFGFTPISTANKTESTSIPALPSSIATTFGNKPELETSKGDEYIFKEAAPVISPFKSLGTTSSMILFGAATSTTAQASDQNTKPAYPTFGISTASSQPGGFKFDLINTTTVLNLPSSTSSNVFGMAGTNKTVATSSINTFAPSSSFGIPEKKSEASTAVNSPGFGSTVISFASSTSGQGFSPSTVSTQSVPAFNFTPATTTNLFASNTKAPPAFGATTSAGFSTAPATSTPAFGTSTPVFTKPSLPTFGTTNVTPAFGTTSTPSFATTSVVGVTTASTTSFTAPISFGNTAAGFGTQTGTTSFEKPAPAPAVPSFGFGNTTTAATTTNPSAMFAFGSSNTSAKPFAFGTTAAQTTTTPSGNQSIFSSGAFGQTNVAAPFGSATAQSSGGSGFGSGQNLFGSPPNPSGFGNANQPAGFDSKSAQPGAFGSGSNLNDFGANKSQNVFGGNTNQPVVFGAGQSGGAFGSGTNQNQSSGAFGSGSSNPFGSTEPANTFGAATTQPNAFGATQATTTQPNVFGATQTTTFGPPPVTAFGSTTTSALFGSSPATGFGASASSPPTGFGASASSPPTGFGASASSGFGSPPGTGFGSVPSASSFGSNTTGSFPPSNQQPAPFGSTTQASKPFGDFGASQQKQQQPGVFTFGAAPQPTTTTSTSFQFGSNQAAPKPGGFNFQSSGTPNFNFTAGNPSFGSPSAAPPAFGPPAAQFNAPGMFSIGSGGAAPKQRPIRARRRN